MKEAFRERQLRRESLDLIEACNEVIEEYMGDGMTMTLRQLYYQLVTKNTIVNSEKSYKRLGSIVSDGRLCGLIDWDAIEDRGRRPRLPNEFKDIEQLVNAAIASYSLPRWEGQRHYAELWVEKDALAVQPAA